jgi:raffinose/stachyose/melibiose transport system substrate-binding protein
MMNRRISRRSVLAGAGALGLGAAAGGILSACSPGGTAPVVDDNIGKGSGEVDLWIDIQGDANQQYFLDVLKAFTAAVPAVTVKPTFYKGADLRTQIQTALQARSGPDIVRGPSATQTLTWAKAQVLADLTPYANHWGWGDTLSSWAMNAFTKDGKLRALPMRVDTMMIYYNKTLFADKGWTTPKTRSEFEDLATEQMGQGIIPFGSSNVDWKAAGEWLMTIFWNHYAGPDALHQALSGEIKFTDPVFVDTVALLKSYFDKGWFTGGADKWFSVPAAEVSAGFGNGTYAMIPQGVWFMSQVGQYFGERAQNENDWDWMPIPALRSEVAYPLYELGIGGSFALNAASDNPDAAAQYLNWYYTDRAAALKRMADVPATYNIPITIEDADIPSGIDPRAGRVLSELNAAVKNGNYGYVTWTWWPPQTDVFIYQGLEKVLTGQMSPADYCKEVDALFTEESNEGNLPQLLARGAGT